MSENGAQSLLELATGPHFDYREHSHKDAASSGADNNKIYSADLVTDPKEVTSTGTRKWYKCWSKAVEKGVLESATTTPAQLDTDKATTGIAQKKTTARGVERSGAKRGGQRHGGVRSSSFWRRVGRAESPHHEMGDLVEAEWMNTGWWYVGYVKGKETGGGKQEGVYRVAFADGDEADVREEALRKLGFSGHMKGSAGILPRHVPIADLGARVGRLYRNPDVLCTQNSKADKQGGNISTFQNRNEEKVGQKPAQVRLDANGGSDEQAEVAALLQRESSSNIQDQQKQGVQGARCESTPSRGSAGGWWETGTQYAFQPHIDPDAAWRGGAPDGGDIGVSVMHAHDTIAGSVFSYAGGRATLDGGASRNEKLLRALQPAEENNVRGHRIYFVV